PDCAVFTVAIGPAAPYVRMDLGCRRAPPKAKIPGALAFDTTNSSHVYLRLTPQQLTSIQKYPVLRSADAMPTATQDLRQLTIDTIRTLAMDAVQAANSGHPGTPMALAPVAYKLWADYLRYDPDQP